MPTLGPTVSALRLQDEIVFLDLRRDAYSVVRDPQRGLQLDTQSTRVAFSDPDLLAELSAAGLVDPEGAAAPLEPPARGCAGVSPIAHARPSAFEVAAFVRASAQTAVLHRVSTLRGLVRWARRRPRRDHHTGEVLRLAAVCADLSVWSPFQGDCLFRSHLLLRFLRLCGADAEWVFAVRTWPFAAHCWLEAQACVLNDEPDRLRGFHPLLVV